MEPIRKINDDLSIAGQISLDQVQDLVTEGFQTIVNLRSPDEQNFPIDERIAIEASGLQYLNHPVIAGDLDVPRAVHLLECLHQLPKPILIHCDTAMRSAAIALLWVATQHGTTIEQALQQATRLGLLEITQQPSAICEESINLR
jgi:uncharacterized protein (TIGR01244 family)